MNCDALTAGILRTKHGAGVVGIVGAVVGFVASQLWRDHQAEQRAIGRELRADKRAQRDTKLARMRIAFKPVILAAWGLQTAGNEFFMSAGDPRVTSAAILETLSMERINEARADLLLEGDVRDVFDELQRMHTAIALAVTLCHLTPHEAIVAGTINAAHALGRGQRTGALVPGRRADLVTLETDDCDLCYRLGALLVRETYAAGRRVA